MVEVDVVSIDATIAKLLGIIQTLIVAFGTAIFDQIGNLVQNQFSNSVGVLMISFIIGITALLTVRKAGI